MQTQGDLRAWYRLNAEAVVGLDEAGRGPLAGPVVAAAVILKPKRRLPGLDDSKKLTEAKRERLYDQIIRSSSAFGFGVVTPAEIDRMNILRASLHAMQLAFEDLQSKLDTPVLGALVDGNQAAPLPPTVAQHTVVDGDAIWPVIMAASVLAKVLRDRMMVQIAEHFPGYGFELHKGYGTPLHLDALRRLGPTPMHRQSFAPVRETFQLGLGL